jgi:hypothetical protein
MILKALAAAALARARFVGAFATLAVLFVAAFHKIPPQVILQ